MPTLIEIKLQSDQTQPRKLLVLYTYELLNSKSQLRFLNKWSLKKTLSQLKGIKCSKEPRDKRKNWKLNLQKLILDRALAEFLKHKPKSLAHYTLSEVIFHPSAGPLIKLKTC